MTETPRLNITIMSLINGKQKLKITTQGLMTETPRLNSIIVSLHDQWKMTNQNYYSSYENKQNQNQTTQAWWKKTFKILLNLWFDIMETMAQNSYSRFNNKHIHTIHINKQLINKKKMLKLFADGLMMEEKQRFKTVPQGSMEEEKKKKKRIHFLQSTNAKVHFFFFFFSFLNMTLIHHEMLYYHTYLIQTIWFSSRKNWCTQ